MNDDVHRLLSMELRFELDVVLARQRARQLGALLKFDLQAQTRIATAVSEIARNAFRYATDGKVEFSVCAGPVPAFQILVTDRGPGIADLQAVLGGTYRSKTGMGIGLAGARRLMDDCAIDTAPDRGTAIRLRKALPARAGEVSEAAVAALRAELGRLMPASPLDAARTRNVEQAKALAQLQQREAELGQLNRELEHTNRSILDLYAQIDDKAQSLERANRELEETNRGIIALYAELDEKAASLARASEVKTRFLSHVSHELRTPLNAILSLVELMHDRTSKHGTGEQDKQLAFIRRSANELAEMVDDLLDTAKVEAGKTVVKVEELSASDLFTSLRGMFKPLLDRYRNVELVIDEPLGIPVLCTDPGKVAQILRNFIANALKFTKSGSVRVTAAMDGPERVLFAVADTGIGIGLDDQARLFQEFSQIEGPHQSSVKGTGLGLALSRKLARILGGEVSVTSSPGVGSTFVALVPVTYTGEAAPASATAGDPPTYSDERLRELARLSDLDVRGQTEPAPSLPPPRHALIIDDSEIARFLIADLLAEDGYVVSEADGGRAGLEAALKIRPDVIFLDLIMPEVDGFAVLSALKEAETTRTIPVIVNSSKVLSQEEQLYLGTVTAGRLAKDGISRSAALAQVRAALTKAGLGVPRW